MSRVRLWRFHGGLKLDSRTTRPAAEPIGTVPLPSRLVLPLVQHVGQPAEPVVAAGARVLKGQPIARPSGYIGAKVHASSSGTVVGIEDHPVPHPSGLSAPCIVIETDGRDEPWAGYEPLTAFGELGANALRARVRAAGVVGLGGAAFPTAVKLGAGSGMKLLILNGAECEPYICCDEVLLRERAGEVVTGAQILMQALEIARCCVAIEDDKPTARRALEAALAAAGETRIEVVSVPAIYPEGGERQLIKVLTGEEVPARGLPPDIGYLCQNVGTAAAVARAVVRGEPLLSRIVTVTGDGVARPRNLEVRLGTPVAALIKACGGYTERAAHLLMGGAMMGFPLADDSVPVVKGTNCIVVASRDEIRPRAPARPCIRCGECAEVCPAQLLPQQLYWHARSGELDRLDRQHLFDCIECGCCDVACPSHLPLTQYFRYAKTELWARDRDRERSDLARERFEARRDRIEAEQETRRRRLEEKTRAAELARGDENARKAMIEAALERVQARRDRPKGDGQGPDR
ncbi:MAG TPA: electron transport complex subunit RsxC [Gammaproteobacteria bacterium]|nr:electron transport complex subunit RsxC [Gammaproteobacteria bacterium]